MWLVDAHKLEVHYHGFKMPRQIIDKRFSQCVFGIHDTFGVITDICCMNERIENSENVAEEREVWK